MKYSTSLNVSSSSDYNSFGMITEGRAWNVGSEYRYGFDGMENDDKIAGNDNALDFGARIYDSRLGRWFSTDPMEKKYASLSPYLGMGNNPIFLIDKEGMDIYVYYVGQDKTVTVAQITSNLKIEITLNSEVVPKEFTNLVLSETWNPLTYTGEEFNNLPSSKKSLWVDFKADAKMHTIAFSGTALVQGQIEIDIVTINPNAESADAGKTFAYFSAGLGFGATSTIAGWGISAAKGNVKFNESLGEPLNRFTFEGFSFTKTAEFLIGKTWLNAYGCECPEYMFYNDSDKSLYTAEMLTISLSGVISAGSDPPGSASTVETHAWLIGEIEIKPSDAAAVTTSSEE